MNQLNLIPQFITQAATRSNPSYSDKRASHTYSTSFSKALDQTKATYNKEAKDKTSSKSPSKSQSSIEKDHPSPTKQKPNIEAIDEDTYSNKEEFEELLSEEDKQDILELISQSLNLPLEQVQIILEDKGLQIQDLLRIEGFSDCIQGLIGEENMAVLLTEESPLESVTNLFQTLQEKAEELLSLTRQQDKETQYDLEVIDLQVQGAQVEQQESNQVQTREILNTSALVETEEEVEEQSILQEQETLTIGEEGTKSIQGLGITVPIKHFHSMNFHSQYSSSVEAGGVGQAISTEGSHFILEQLDFKEIGQLKELNIQLSPKALGTMNIRLIENNGVLIAEIKVDNDRTKTFIQEEIQALKERLQEQGLNISEVKVDIRQNHAKSQMQQERQKSSKRIQELIRQQFEIEEEIEPEQQDHYIGESEVNYMI